MVQLDARVVFRNGQLGDEDDDDNGDLRAEIPAGNRVHLCHRGRGCRCRAFLRRPIVQINGARESLGLMSIPEIQTFFN